MGVKRRLKRNFPLLRTLLNCNRKKRLELIADISPDLLEAICDIAHNILNGNIVLKESRKRYLSRNKAFLRYLANKNTSTITKQKKIIQNGGFIGALLPAILGPIIGLIAGATT